MNLNISKNKKIGIILIIIATIFGIFKITRSKEKESYQAISVQTETLKKDTINIMRNFIAKVRTFESVTLSSEVVGRITYMKKDGSFVKKGEIILELDSTEAEGRYMRALGRKNEEEIKLKNIENMFKEGYKSKIHVEEQVAKHQTATGELKEAEANLNKHRIRAPFEGVIGLHTQSLGATVNQHTKLITVTNLKNLQIEFTIPDSELKSLGGIEKIKESKMFVTLEGNLLSIPAKFAAAETVLDAETNGITIRAYLLQEENITSPGQMCQVTLNIGTKEDAITIPESALEKAHGTEYVYKVIKNTAVQIGVKSGVKDGERIEILEGLKEGDIVVSSGQYSLTDGQKVIIEEK